MSIDAKKSGSEPRGGRTAVTGGTAPGMQQRPFQSPAGAEKQPALLLAPMHALRGLTPGRLLLRADATKRHEQAINQDS